MKPRREWIEVRFNDPYRPAKLFLGGATIHNHNGIDELRLGEILDFKGESPSLLMVASFPMSEVEDYGLAPLPHRNSVAVDIVEESETVSGADFDLESWLST